MVNKRNWFPHLTLSVSIGIVVFILVGCTTPTGNDPQASLEVVSSSSSAEPTENPPRSTTVETEGKGTPTSVSPSSPDQTAEADEVERSTPVPTATYDPSTWQDLPVIPVVNDRARDIYYHGLSLGNNPRAFAKVGDCQNVPSMFLSIFSHEGFYSLREEDAYLRETIEWFDGSFSRESEAVRRGFNAASVLSPLWANPESCDPGETPLDCEIRLHQPSIALVSLETWWEGNPEKYEQYVREILETLIDHGILPVLATKADNLEGDHRINIILTRLAYEYDIPLWNFWRAIQPLPNQGLMEDGFHLTFAENHFDDPEAMRAAWPWRNLTALQVLNSVWQGVSAP